MPRHIRCRAACTSSVKASLSYSRLTQPIKQRPRQHKRHDTAKHVARPQVAERPEEVSLRVAVGFERKDEQGYDGRADKVEDEARPGLEA